MSGPSTDVWDVMSTARAIRRFTDEPVVAVLLGILVLGEQLTVHGPAVMVLPVAVAAMLAGTIALGRDSAALDEKMAHGHSEEPDPAV